MLNQLGKAFGGVVTFTALISILSFYNLIFLSDIGYAFIYLFFGFLFIESLTSSYNKNRYLLLLVQTLIWFKYYYIPLLILSQSEYDSPFGLIDKSSYILSTIYALVCMYAIRLAYLIASSLLINRKRKNDLFELYNLKIPNSFFFLGLISVFVFLIIHKASSLSSDFSNRLIENQGGGFLHIFGYIGYFLSLYCSISFVRNCGKLTSLKALLVLLSMFLFGTFFLLLGYRGGFLYPLIFFFIVYYAFKVTNFRSIFVYLLILLFLVFEINWFTGAIRIIVSRGDDFNVENLVSSYNAYKSMYLIPMAFNHIDLTALYITNNELRLLTGSFNTVIPTFFNWIPRALMSDKELTTGALMAVEIFPGAIGTQGRTSSLTTGVIFESIYNYGLLIGPLFLMIFYTFVFYLIKALSKKGGVFFILSILLIWNFAFSIFFDDFGGGVNKLITLLLTTFIVYFFYSVSRVLNKNA